MSRSAAPSGRGGFRDRIRALLRRGTQFSTSAQERKRIVTFNAFLWIALLSTVLYGVSMGQRSFAFAMLTTVVGAAIAAALVLSAHGHFTAGKATYVSVASGAIAFFMSHFERADDVVFYIPVISAMCIAVTGPDEHRLRIFGSVLPLALAIAAKAGLLGSGSAPLPLASALDWAFVPLALVLLVVPLAVFAWKNTQLLEEAAGVWQLHATVLDSIDDAVFVADTSGGILRVNPAGLALIGGEESELLAQPLSDFVNREEGRALTSDGENVSVEVRANTSQIAGKTIEVLVLRDLRAEEVSAQRERKLRDELKGASRRAGMSEIARSVLHNVGNVLNSVSVSAGLMRDLLRASRAHALGKIVERLMGDDSPSVSEDPKLLQLLHMVTARIGEERGELLGEVDRIGTGLEHIREIVQRQNAVANHDAVRETCTVADLLRDASTLVSASFARHGIEFSCRAPAGLAPRTVHVDRLLVAEVLVNLLKNAREATDEVPPPHRVSLEAGMDDETLLLAVVDNGVGFSASQRARLFESGHTTKPRGQGLGLHESANAVGAQGGNITARSEGPGEGATFTLRLPVQSEGTAARTDAPGVDAAKRVANTTGVSPQRLSG